MQTYIDKLQDSVPALIGLFGILVLLAASVVMGS
jgi:hypothetical protein